MIWHQIEGRWHQMTPHLKAQWRKRTDDALDDVGGKREQLIGKLRERYGLLAARGRPVTHKYELSR